MGYAVVGYLVGIITTLITLAFLHGAKETARSREAEQHIYYMQDAIRFLMSFAPVACNDDWKKRINAVKFGLDCVRDMGYEGRNNNDMQR